MRPLALALLVALPGCLGADAPAPEASPQPAPPEDDAPFALDAPDLPVGRAWRYRMENVYDPDPELAIVVASKSPDGYLFAAGREDDLVGEAVWGRDWYGPRTPALVAAEEGAWNLFDFPLRDGDRWALSPRLNVTARAAEVETPTGTERGFIVEGSEGARRMRLEYAPSVGFLVSMRYEFPDGAYDLRLVETSVATERVWYEAGDGAYLGTQDGKPAAGALAVAGRWDALLVSAGGQSGGRVFAAPPPGADAPAAFEFPAAARWDARVLPAHEGTWTLGATAPADGWAYVAARPVRWLHGPVDG